jgi:hypothetical protein
MPRGANAGVVSLCEPEVLGKSHNADLRECSVEILDRAVVAAVINY